jgi:hypothetical protein
MFSPNALVVTMRCSVDEEAAGGNYDELTVLKGVPFLVSNTGCSGVYGDHLVVSDGENFSYTEALHEGLKTVWHTALRRAKVPYFGIYDLRLTYATRLSAGGVADEWVTQLLRQSDARCSRDILR